VQLRVAWTGGTVRRWGDHQHDAVMKVAQRGPEDLQRFAAVRASSPPVHRDGGPALAPPLMRVRRSVSVGDVVEGRRRPPHCSSHSCRWDLIRGIAGPTMEVKDTADPCGARGRA
jgi:hypothetical protein